MLKIFQLLFGLISLGGLSIAQGVVIPSLYTAEIAVASQSPESRVVAFGRGLKEVLIKVSGNGRVTEVSGLNEAIQNPTNYVQTFSYRSAPLDSEGQVLIVKFNKQSIDELLKHNEQPIWGQDRPLTLVWLIEKKTNGVEILNPAREMELNQLFMNQANFRGVSWLFPLLDMTDFQQINVNTVWNASTDVFKLISQRYAPDEILIIRVDESQPSSINASFSLVFPDKILNWNEEDKDRLLIFKKGLESTIDHLVERFANAQPQENSNVLNLRIENLKNIEDYAKLMKYLHSLTGVESVDVSNISFPILDVKLGLTVSVDSLKRTIQLNSVLQPVAPSDLQASSSQEFLTYQFHSI